MAGVRTTHSSSLLSLLIVGGLAVAGCGDGIDERTEPLAPEQAVVTTTTEPEPVELPSFEFDEPDVVVDNTKADYSGARSALQLSDGTWLVTGYDNHSTFIQPEPGAVWRGDDIGNLERTGDTLSDEEGQQVIASLLELDSGRVVAVGTNYSRDDPEAEFYTHDADVWLSDDQGSTFEKVSLRLDASVAGAIVVDGVIYVHGFQFGEGDDGLATGQIWRSDDDGETWDELNPAVSPTPGAAPEPLGTIGTLLHWDGSLIALGLSTSTDPDGGDYPLDRYSLSSGTEEWEPVDVGLWYSDDLGLTWHAPATNGMVGLPNAQIASDAVVVGDQLVIVGSASDLTQAPFDFDPGDFGSDDFDPEEFDIDDFDPEDFEFTESFVQPTLWTCDYLLQRCQIITVETDGSGFISAQVVERDGVAIATFSTFSSDSEDGEYVVTLDPLSGEFESTEMPSAFAQTSALVVDGDRLVLFGRHARLNELDALIVNFDD